MARTEPKSVNDNNNLLNTYLNRYLINTYLNRLLTVDEDTIQQELALLTNISHHGRL